MATTTVSIGSRTTTVDTETPASSSGGSGPLYVVTFGTTPSGIAVGDMGFMDTEDAGSGSPSDYEFVVTAISGANITLKYLRDTGSKGDHSPLGLYTGAGSSGSPTQAAMVFKRHGLPTSSADGAAPSSVDTFSDAGPPADSDVGDIAFVAGASANFEYLITAIDLSAKTATMKYLTGSGQTSPYGIAGSGGTQAVLQFKRAFSTITLFEAMIDDASPTYWGSTDDVVGECHADSPFTDDSRVYFDNKQSLASVKLTVNSDDRHDGTEGTGVVIRPTAGSGHNNAIIDVNIDNFIMEWIEIDLGDLDSTNTNKAVLLRGTNDNNIIRNNLIHDKGGNPGGTGPFMVHVVAAGSSGDTISVLNNIIYNIVEGSNDNAAALLLNTWSGTANVYNNTIYNIQSAGGSKIAIGIRIASPSGSTANVKNNIVAGLVSAASNGERAYEHGASDTGNGTLNEAYNLSDDTSATTYDASGTGSLIDKSLAEIDFVSVGVGTEDLHIDTDSVCLEAGVDLGTTNEVNIDIDGVDRDATGVTWDIGADQASTADTGNPAFLMFVD